jgi:hypothetical protein
LFATITRQLDAVFHYGKSISTYVSNNYYVLNISILMNNLSIENSPRKI